MSKNRHKVRKKHIDKSLIVDESYQIKERIICQCFFSQGNQLISFRNPEDRFITLGYLAQAFCDAGDCEATLHYALLQMELASEKNDEYVASAQLKIYIYQHTNN